MAKKWRIKVLQRPKVQTSVWLTCCREVHINKCSQSSMNWSISANVIPASPLVFVSQTNFLPQSISFKELAGRRSYYYSFHFVNIKSPTKIYFTVKWKVLDIFWRLQVLMFWTRWYNGSGKIRQVLKLSHSEPSPPQKNNPKTKQKQFQQTSKQNQKRFWPLLLLYPLWLLWVVNTLSVYWTSASYSS